jgi:hypothetical protein
MVNNERGTIHTINTNYELTKKEYNVSDIVLG